MPKRIGNDGNTGVAYLHDLLNARHAGDLGGIEALDRAAVDRTIRDGRDQHVRHLDVDAVDLLAGQLVVRIEALEALAGDLPVLDVLELDVFRWIELGGGFGDLAERRRAPRRLMGDNAVRRAALRGRHAPRLGGGLDKHLASG